MDNNYNQIECKNNGNSKQKTNDSNNDNIDKKQKQNEGQKQVQNCCLIRVRGTRRQLKTIKQL